jgi:hypothetical protein
LDSLADSDGLTEEDPGKTDGLADSEEDSLADGDCDALSLALGLFEADSLAL